MVRMNFSVAFDLPNVFIFAVRFGNVLGFGTKPGEAPLVFSRTAYTCNESAVCGCADF